MSSNNEVRASLQQFVLGKLAPRGITTIADDEPLMDGGHLDSLGVFQLVAFIEETLRLRVADDEITLENFGTLGGIVRLVEAKHAGRDGRD